MKNAIGNRIRIARENKNYTQRHVADFFSITQSSYSRLEKDDDRISVNQLLKLSKLLDVSTTYLLFGRSDERPPGTTVYKSDEVQVIIIENQ